MATSETRDCQNCKQGFVIEPDDFAFYEKIKVPPPTWCPECRMVRRMNWRNERALYRRKDASGANLLSIYAPETRVVVYERDYWWSDKWDPMTYGRAYDFAKPLFAQFRELLESTPLPNVFSNTVSNSPYANHVGHLKNCYLVFASWEVEQSLYGEKFVRAKDSMDSYALVDSELCYGNVDCEKSHRLAFSQDCQSCIGSAFLFDCHNCSNCFSCAGLRNKQYCIFNTQYTKEEYEQKMQSIDLGSFKVLSEQRRAYVGLALQRPRRFSYLNNTVNTVGDHCSNAKNGYYCFDLLDVEDSKYITYGGFGLKESYDGYGVGIGCELLYEGIDSGDNGMKEKFSVVVYGTNESDYCFNCQGSSNLFACIGLRNKQYCILNKQYTKEEYEALVPRIIQHMNDMPYVDALGREYRYGEFFPPELSPFAYNETIAQEYFPLTKDEALQKGYRWRDPDTKQYVITMKSGDLPDHIKDTDDSILKETIGCMHKGECNEQCTTAFRIIPEELQFYRRMNLPLPRLCPNCRHYERLKQRNPLKLWHRTCMCSGQSANGKQQITYQNTAKHFHGENPCPNEFETSYSPDRPEIVYCEQCYNSEVV
jgi:hypothetical protein